MSGRQTKAVEINGPHRETDALHAALSSIGDAVINTNAEGRVTFLNSVAESLTGWTLKEAADQPIENVFRIINKESRQPVERPIFRALRDGVLANRNLLVAKDGAERPIDDSAVQTRNDDGQTVGVVLVFRDITERRKTERASQKDRLTLTRGDAHDLLEVFAGQVKQSIS